MNGVRLVTAPSARATDLPRRGRDVLRPQGPTQEFAMQLLSRLYQHVIRLLGNRTADAPAPQHGREQAPQPRMYWNI